MKKRGDVTKSGGDSAAKDRPVIVVASDWR